MGEIWKKMFLSEFDVRWDIVVYCMKFMDILFFFWKLYCRVFFFFVDVLLYFEVWYKIK